MEPTYTYSARVLRVVDGDTLHLAIDTGFNNRHITTARLFGINTPELYKGDERDAGKASAEAVLRWLRNSSEDSDYVATWYQNLPGYGRRTKKGFHFRGDCPKVVIQSHDGARIKSGKYGRWLVDVFRHSDHLPENAIEHPLNTYLVEAGFAELKDYT